MCKKMKQLFILCSFLIVTNLHSQITTGRFSVEAGSGPSFAMRETGGVRLKYGRGFDGILALDLAANVGLFGGWATSSFSSNGPFRYHESGVIYGVQYTIPAFTGKTDYLLRVGKVFNHIVVTGSDRRDLYFDSGYSEGFYTSGSIRYLAGRGWLITGTLRYSLMNTRLTLPESIYPDGTSGSEIIIFMPRNFCLSHLGVRVGITKSF
jgi:hypothetical protein